MAAKKTGGTVHDFRKHADREARRTRIAERLGLPPTHPEVERIVQEGAKFDGFTVINAQTLAEDARRLAVLVGHVRPDFESFATSPDAWMEPFREAARRVRRAQRELDRAAETLAPPRRRRKR